jgi:RNA polymerase sigma-70 factor, ECF subfamily
MGSGPADEELMLSYGGGDAGAFETLYRRHRGPLYRFLLRQTGEVAAAEELFQDVWMRVIGASERYQPRAKFSSWLYAIAHNHLMDFYRARGKAAFVAADEAEGALEDLPANELPPEALIDRKRTAERLLAAISALPEAQREAFLLQQEGDLSVEEIGAATGVSRETAKSRLRYALVKLRQTLGTGT